MAGKSYRDLLVRQRAMDLAQAVYESTRGFPKEELYGLTSQLRRAAVSAPSNIAEGQAMQLILAARLGRLMERALTPLLADAGEVGRLLTGLASSLTRRKGVLRPIATTDY